MNKVITIVLLCTVILIIWGIFWLHRPKPITLNENDDGKTINVKVGQVIYIKLQSNPSTGFDWHIKTKPDIVEAVGSVEYINNTDEKLVGAPDTTQFEFKAVKKGTGKLTLIYKRNWEGELPSSQMFSITINIS